MTDQPKPPRGSSGPDTAADPASATAPRKRPWVGWTPWSIRPDGRIRPRTPEDALTITTPEDGTAVTTRKDRP